MVYCVVAMPCRNNKFSCCEAEGCENKHVDLLWEPLQE